MTTATITLADLARAYKLNPKVCRAKIRRYVGSPKPVNGQKYVFPAKSKAALLKFLKS